MLLSVVSTARELGLLILWLVMRELFPVEECESGAKYQGFVFQLRREILLTAPISKNKTNMKAVWFPNEIKK